VRGGAASRRQVLLAGAAALLAGCSSSTAPVRELVIAGGPQGGSSLRQSRLLAAALQTTGAAGSVRVLPTAGSAENLALLQAGRAHLALCLADAVVRAAWRPTALARSHSALLQLLVRDDSPVTRLDDLRGRRTSVGLAGSGTADTGSDLVAGFTPDERAGLVHRGLRDSVIALAAGRLDAVLWWGGLPPAEVASVHRAAPLRPLDLSGALAAMSRLRPGAYELAGLPAAAYDRPARTPTLGVADLLVCRADLPDGVARAVVGLCLTRAPQLVPQPSDGVPHLERSALVDTAPVPLHEAAADAYRRAYG